MRTVETRTGATLPVLGQGTWEMGARRRERQRDIAALQLGFDLGLTLVDTAEMYADGGAEEVVAAASRGRRDRLFLVTKVLPSNASRRGTMAAAEASLRRLQTDWIDLYLLHWEGSHPLEDTLEAFALLQRQGKIRHYGVSNFDMDWMRAVEAVPEGAGVAVNQVFYNLHRRGIERNLLPWCVERGIAIMAYTPLDQGRLVRKRALVQVAQRHGVSPSQIAIAWTLRLPGVVTIVKSATTEYVRENAAAADMVLGAEDLRELDDAFPCPDHDVPLETV